ncbi:9f6061ae-621c-402c-be81-c7d09c08300b-CDS [Sclerotinia trifoliorum]|uniref:9f6061ae-621c-402c-be81-c7d09c08300b-CDS n=1 Tax=Sclerotinia trifoliorum TaxID=28548 RepID=A0A8H2ZVN2_9HELO|nr:9f6061ae-621c-402c-be81-c7d09c08300b-CDS [Sclerotinia trifoliorum]
MSASYTPKAIHYEEGLEDQEFQSEKGDNDDNSKTDEEESFFERSKFPSHQKQHSHKQKVYLVAAFAILICIASITFGTYSTMRFQALKHNCHAGDQYPQHKSPTNLEQHTHSNHGSENHEHEHKHEHEHQNSPTPSTQPSTNNNPTNPTLDCGTTETTAKAANCTFNLMSFSYIPTGCTDTTLLPQFTNSHATLPPDSAGTFPWYRWSNRTEPVPQDAEQLSKYPFIWTTHEWHIAHCLYNWALTSAAIGRVLAGERNVWVLGDAVEGAHIAHCNGLVSDRVTSGLTPLRAFRAIGRCVRLDVDGGALGSSRNSYAGHGSHGGHD